ncbi:hypothetical protein DH2020_025619 [Rehmannia glutinosa]|uniref:WRKY domain-containing protein n=1 Tax=Rehmannia glutinosa TaxID=99300 RepID=A0ABR0W1W5_REHGL
MEDDWDLHAVVRGCAALTTTSSAAAAVTNRTPFGQVFSSSFQQDYNFEDLFEPRRETFVQDLYKPFYFKSPESSQIVLSPQSIPISPLSVLGGLQDVPTEQQHQQIVKQLPQQTQLRQKHHSFSVANASKPTVSHNPSSRSKRRKNHTKKVCHVSAENLSSDVWSWRKYGQKPIKGSPYPSRGYYRCSTLKGCMARKQVERNRSDPGMFIVTYTGEHSHPMPTHRNSLAGSIRQKQPETPNSDDSTKNPSSPDKLESSREDLDDDDDDFSVSKMELDDDFFAGLEDFTAPDSADFTSGHFPANFQFSWTRNSATTIAGGG